MAKIDGKNVPTLKQFKKQCVSEMWGKYKEARDRLDKSFDALASASFASGTPTCDSGDCSGKVAVDVNGEVRFMCRQNNEWVLCNP